MNWPIHFLNGISYGMLLFLFASGFTLTFGLARVLNVAHGSFYLLAGYLGLTVATFTGNFLLAVVTASIGVALAGLLLERSLLNRFYDRPLGAILLTIGVAFIVADGTLWIWGGSPTAIPPPETFKGALRFGEFAYPRYRFLVMGVGVIAAILLWLLQEKTKTGAIVRAGVDDAEMVRGMGINLPRVFSAVFALGTLLAGMAGVVGGGFAGGYPGADFEVLLLAVAVVIIGGLGSLKGALCGSIIIGLTHTFGQVFFPSLALFTIFAPTAIILVYRPWGLFGRVTD